MRQQLLLRSLAAALLAGAGAAQRVANVLDFGADATGRSLTTAAFVAALDALAPAGGVLYVPPGTYLLSPFNVTTSHVELRLDNATLRATQNFSAWQIIQPLPSYGRGRDFPGPRYEPLIGLWNVTHVRVTSNSSGPSVIDGQGAAWWAAVVDGSLKVTPGHLLEALWSSFIELDRVHLVDSPFWTIHIYASEYVHVHDLQVTAPTHSTNTDGCDPDSSSHVLLERLNISTGDDCIAIKAGWAPWATWHHGVRAGYSVPTTNVTIRELTCTTQSACLAVGSEMSGGVADVTATGIRCLQAGQGLNVKSALGRGGYIRNVTFADVAFGPGRVGVAFAVVGSYRDQYPPAPVNATLVPLVGGVTIRNATAVGAAGSLGSVGDFSGLAGAGEGEITGVTIEDVDVTAGLAPGGKPAWACANVSGTSARVLPAPCAQLAAAGPGGAARAA